METKIYPYLGPYQGSLLKHTPRLVREVLEHMWEQHFHTRPLPQRDGIVLSELPADCRFGFLYREDLDRWFDGYMDALSQAGFHVVCYQVDEDRIALGHSGQVAFDRNFADRQKL